MANFYLRLLKLSQKSFKSLSLALSHDVFAKTSFDELSAIVEYRLARF